MKAVIRLISGIIALSAIFSITSSAEDNNIYTKVSNDDMRIALTFDDGPHPVRTPEILDILEEYNVKATFFVIGKNIENYPEVFVRTASLGHEIGNHTFTHRSLREVSDDGFADELTQFENAISKYYDQDVTSIRPPGGLYNDNFEAFAKENGLDIVLWSVDTHDWAHKSVEDIVDNVLSNTDSGDIILMHDYISGKSPTPEALKIIIPKLLERGFEFVTISELIGSKTKS